MAAARPKPQISDENSLEVGELARRLNQELELAVFEAHKCQDAVSEILELGGGHHGDPLLRLQALDGLTQHLIELSQVVGGLAVLEGLGRAPTSLFDNIRLAEVKRRLNGGDRATRDGHDDLELW